MRRKALTEEFRNYVNFRSGGKEQVCELHGVHIEILLTKLDIPGGNFKVVLESKKVIPVQVARCGLDHNEWAVRSGRMIARRLAMFKGESALDSDYRYCWMT
jgi:hypothetical protein